MDNTKYVQLIGRCELRKVLFCASKDMDGAQHEGECESAITDLLARAEAAEAENSQLDGTVATLMESNRLLSERCGRLEEARENANEACAKWEALCHMAEQERDTYKAALQNWHEEG